MIHKHKKLVLLSGLILGLLLVIIGAKVHADKGPFYYANCTEARANHDTNIPISSKYYRQALDRDHNGIACQQ